MRYDKRQIAEKLLRWERFLQAFSLPSWEEFPTIELYMDQVIVLVNSYLGYLVYEGSDEKLITAAMVNNYVKQKLLPPPVRKRYGRAHLACLMMICTLKQTLSMAAVKRMLPRDEADIRRQYECFRTVHRRLSLYFTEQVRAGAPDIFDASTDTGSEVNTLVLSGAVAASLAKLMTGKIIALQLPDEPERKTGRKAEPHAAPPAAEEGNG